MLTPGFKYFQSTFTTARQINVDVPAGYKYYTVALDRGSQLTGSSGAYYPVHFAQTSGQLDLVSPVLAVTTVLSGMYAVGAATFGWNYHLTKYTFDKRPQLTFAWPFLYLLNKDFREEFVTTWNGKRSQSS
eukprot:TRINITY_DN13765_c0_g1_i2.p2 TRINITY_DN13765_c0_g1~~TRINITY_DN13765_c0_g1_i2.p2  ORF type:complete len:131 (+),score=14.83 TRINITY_DN13765_c0_g1_i2:82-474(+)